MTTRTFIEEVDLARKVWMEENPCEDGVDHVTPFDRFLYGGGPSEVQRCTCPSGDGSLRWPCPAHPPEAQPTPIGDLLADYEANGCDFTDLAWVRAAARGYVKTMPDSQVRCLLHVLAQTTAEAQARPAKPAECADGCPALTVCDHCQWPPGPDAEAQGGGEVVEPIAGDLLPCPFCGKSNQDRWPCEWLDGTGANVIRCAWCHGAAPASTWNRRTAPPSAPAGVDGCTESNCPRCLTHPDHRGDMAHAGIGSYPAQQPPTAPVGVEAMLSVAEKAWNEHQTACRFTTVSGSLKKVCEALAQQSAADEEAAEQYRKGWQAGHAAAQQPAAVDEAMVAIKSAIAELDALRNAMFKTYAAAANGADKAKLLRLIEAERNAYEAHYSLPKLQAALAPQPAACDMGDLCIGCEPRNTDGSCPDQQPAAVDRRHPYVQSKDHGGCANCGYPEWEPWHVLAAQPKRYNHMYTVAFTVISSHPEGLDVTPEDFRKALTKRMNDLDLSGEWDEAVGAPDDTYEMED